MGLRFLIKFLNKRKEIIINLSFNIGNSENLHSSILALAWGNTIQLIQITLEGQSETVFSYKSDFFNLMEVDLISISWIAPSLLICFDNRRRASILFSGDFTEGQLDINKKNNFNNNKAILNQITLETQLVFQDYIKDSNDRTRASYYNTVAINLENKSIVILTHKKIFRGKIFTWFYQK